MGKNKREVPQIFDHNIFVTFSLTINSNCGNLNGELDMINNNNNFLCQSRLFEDF